MPIDFKKYKRFFAFGCSMTQYSWPTWADIIALEIPESYNYGRSGAGNIYISNMIAEANMRYQFNSDDLVMVMWSTVVREDRYVNGWHCHGNIYFQGYYDDEYLKKYVDNRGQLIRDLGLITLSDGLLSSIGCDYHMMCMQPLHLALSHEVKVDDVVELYAPTIEKLFPDLLSEGCNGIWPQIPIKRNVPGGQTFDYHPTTKMHFNYIKKILPEFKFNPSTVAFVEKNELLIGKATCLEDLTWNVPLTMPPCL